MYRTLGNCGTACGRIAKNSHLSVISRDSTQSIACMHLTTGSSKYFSWQQATTHPHRQQLQVTQSQSYPHEQAIQMFRVYYLLENDVKRGNGNASVPKSQILTSEERNSSALYRSNITLKLSEQWK